jgi:aryl-alcohol dehydrogenase-like predicted oxidoreductase
LQPLYNLLDRDTEWELLPVCRNEGLGVIPWSPLRGGWLSGKVRRGMTSPPSGTRLEIAESRGMSEKWSAYDNEHTWRVLDELFAVADEAGKTPAQVALRWLLQRPGVTAPIIGARNREQLDANLGSTGWALTEDHLARLAEASAKPLPYPYAFITADPERA